MSVYGLTAVHLGTGDRIERAKIQKVDPVRNALVGETMDLAAHELADLLIGGDRIQSVFRAGGGTAPGPWLKARVYPGGKEGVELSEDAPGMSVHDLDQY